MLFLPFETVYSILIQLYFSTSNYCFLIFLIILQYIFTILVPLRLLNVIWRLIYFHYSEFPSTTFYSHRTFFINFSYFLVLLYFSHIMTTIQLIHTHSYSQSSPSMSTYRLDLILESNVFQLPSRLTWLFSRCFEEDFSQIASAERTRWFLGFTDPVLHAFGMEYMQRIALKFDNIFLRLEFFLANSAFFLIIPTLLSLKCATPLLNHSKE